MTAQWYCLIKDREHGPFSSQQIQQLAERGKLKPEHSVRPETDSHWTPASAIPGLFPEGGARATPPIAKAAPPKVAKKRSPDGRQTPPSSASSTEVPQAIPVAGVPAATPVATPVGNPVATPVASPVAAPIATPVAGAGRASGIPGVAAPPAPGVGARSGAEYAKRGRRKSQQLYIVVGTLVGITVILIGVAAIVVLKGPPPAQPDSPVAPTTPAADRDGPVADPELDPYADAVPEPTVATFPSLGRWLDATRQKGGLRGVAKIEIPDVWMEKTANGDRVLNIAVKVTNLASDKSLSFRGWSASGAGAGKTSALLADDQGEMLQPVPAAGTTTGNTATALRIKSDESHIEHLRFSLADSTSSCFRLALPYAAIGHTGYLGFEIPILMVQDHPPGEEPPDVPAAPTGTEGDAPVGADAAGKKTTDATQRLNDSAAEDQSAEAASEAPSAGGQPATIKDLMRSIGDEAESDGASDRPLP